MKPLKNSCLSCSTCNSPDLSFKTGHEIISKAKCLGLSPEILYETVLDLSNENLYTANCINLAAGILLNDLGLPEYFFKNITKNSLKSILDIIAGSLEVKNGKVILSSRVPNASMTIGQGENAQQIRIATEATRDSFENKLAPEITGHRREYHHCPKTKYYTYIVNPEKVLNYSKEHFKNSRFLFEDSKNFTSTPKATRNRYNRFLDKLQNSISPLIESSYLSDINQTRIMFNSDFELPQLPIFRKLLEEYNLILKRAYWEPYYADKSAPSSICSLYVNGKIEENSKKVIIKNLTSFLAWPISDVLSLYPANKLTFEEMIFAGNAIDFVHMFAHRKSSSDRKIISSLKNVDFIDAFTSRIHQANKMEFSRSSITGYAMQNPDLIKLIYSVFSKKFNPSVSKNISPDKIQLQYRKFKKKIATRFLDYPTAYHIFKFMFKIVITCKKTNFYKTVKRSYSFRFTNEILNPVVFDQFVHGIFFVNGHYSSGTHMRADDIARGGLRMLRITKSNYSAELDKLTLLNFALGPKAQRIKHKDICESGAKGVIAPNPIYSKCKMEALYDYTEGILDIIQPSKEIIDYLKTKEMIFFGPDEGTAPLMDAVSYRAKARGYKFWRTITTGKSFGIPHDTYGLLKNGDTFGLFGHDKEGTELKINGKSVITSSNMNDIYEHIGGKIKISGMTTTSVMTAFRTVINSKNDKEENLNLLMTGGPGGDLGANQIQCYEGKICCVIDGGSVLFDPNGLDKTELCKLAFMRHTTPRANSLFYPMEKLSSNGFRVPRLGKNIVLPDGSVIDNGAVFHKTFLTSRENRKIIKQANIQAFIPCGGFKDTVNSNNVKSFLSNFRELKYIIEGANVFFDDSARRRIAQTTKIYHIKDSSANKGGVFSSSMAEVLTAFLFGKRYDEYMLDDTTTRWELIRNIINLIKENTEQEISLLLQLHSKCPEYALFELSSITSENILNLQKELKENYKAITASQKVEWMIIKSYIPEILVKKLGRENILKTLNSESMRSYKKAIITKKIVSSALYRFGLDWDNYMLTMKKELLSTITNIFQQ